MVVSVKSINKIVIWVFCGVFVSCIGYFCLTGRNPIVVGLNYSNFNNGSAVPGNTFGQHPFPGTTSAPPPGLPLGHDNGPCTFGLFRAYFRKYGYIPSGGQWTTIDGELRYQPDLCKYKYELHDAQRMSRCIAKANLTHVVTTGDSNGGYNSEALVQLLAPLKCHRGRNDGGTVHPNAEYYSFYNKTLGTFIKTGNRFCGDCGSKEWFCQETVNSSRDILLEQIATSQTIDNSIHLYIPEKLYYGDHIPDTWALTTQEFVLRYFLKDRYPDIMVITLPFNHDKHINLARLRLDIEQFKSLVEFYVPRRTKLFYIPSFSEFEEPRRRRDFYHRKFDGVLAAEKIDKMNHLLYGILKDDLSDTGGRTYGFIDLWEMSRSREAWSRDGIHMKPVWYQNSMAMFWETYCNSVFDEDF